ncbi:MAG: DMP19 family protein [Prosthecobacter sp.]
MSMSPDDIIEAALKTGARDGLAALTGVSRKVWLISEAETYCAIDGIDSFLDVYDTFLDEAAEAFAAVGAAEIAGVLRSIHAACPLRPDKLLEDADRLINERVGYDYDSVARLVSRSQKGVI